MKWLQLMKCLQFRKRLCICVLIKKRLCILKKSSKICHIFHEKYDIFKEKRAFFTIEGISSGVIISKLRSAFFAYITTNQMKILPHDWMRLSQKAHTFFHHIRKNSTSALKLSIFWNVIWFGKKTLFGSDLLWDVRESFWSH